MATEATPKADYNAAICTLFEGDYHFGLAAFVNSLVHAGYCGTVWAGYRGALPPWLNELTRLEVEGNHYMVTKHVRLALVPLKTDYHFTNYKPHFMLELLADEARESEYIWYFDPDIFLRAHWSFFHGWQRYGITLCEEIVNNNLPDDSPLRHLWREVAASIGLTDPRPLNHYYNAGMVGVAAAHADFLRVWKQLIEHVGQTGGDLKSFMSGTREMPFYSIDQDSLNVVAMYSKFPLSTVGPEGMGFIPGAVLMYHCVGNKPWRGSLVLRALAGFSPSNAAKFFLTLVESPIRAYPPSRLRTKRVDSALAALIGRFYGRK